ncbi:MAG: hypothetical protein LBJ91_04490 [Clostridiales Family XIII bacterium]|jgi:hypothetical protein|nr:hypothetical protein [Clostridiales Family XIII bacterium]
MDNSVDPMGKYYGREAWEVAKEIFGEDFKIRGEFYSIVDNDIPFKIESYGTCEFSDTNLLTGKSGGGRGLYEGIVVPQQEAEALL